MSVFTAAGGVLVMPTGKTRGPTSAAIRCTPSDRKAHTLGRVLLYRPDVNIAIASVYMSELKKEFDNLYEAIAASYNGGEDNAARWLNRSKPREAAIFTSEVGFAESKNYVFKVMNNYRIYRELYTEDLVRK